MMKRLRNMLLTGLVALLPLYLTVTLLIWLFKTMDSLFQPLIFTFFHVEIRGLGLLITLLIIFSAGVILSNVYGALILGWIESFLERLPIFKGIYRNIKRIVESLNPNNPTGFKEFVLVEHSSGQGYNGGFLTGEFTLVKPDGTRHDLASVFIPSNHLYLGAIHVVSRSRIIKLELTPQDGVAFALSAGASIKGNVAQIHSPNG
ncbi:MAG TPA: DUF502 domain-containing protein [Nitrospiria bacterium]|nr:DUF502 domain-containing protein [Nitrospiria bacterium]